MLPPIGRDVKIFLGNGEWPRKSRPVDIHAHDRAHTGLESWSAAMISRCFLVHAVVRIPHSVHHEGHEGLQNEPLDAILEPRGVEIDHR
jgi:hypothetical protein